MQAVSTRWCALVLAIGLAVSGRSHAQIAPAVRANVAAAQKLIRASRFGDAQALLLRTLATPASGLSGEARARVGLAAANASLRAGDPACASRLVAYAQRQPATSAKTQARAARAVRLLAARSATSPATSALAMSSLSPAQPVPASPAAVAAPHPVAIPAPSLSATPVSTAPTDEPALDYTPDAVPSFLRARDTSDQHGELQTATAVYRRASGGPDVHLIGMVHVGTASYYKAASQDLERIDTVLAEGLAGREEAAENFNAPFSRGRQWQTADAGTTDDTTGQPLIHQWVGIAMEHRRFVHCDLSYSELEEVEERVFNTRTAVKYLVNGSLLDQLPGRLDTGIDLKNWALVLAERAPRPGVFAQLRQQVRALVASPPPRKVLDHLILTVRNEHVEQALDGYLNQPRSFRLGVLYGAAHMPALDAHLRGLGYRRTEVRWNTVWSY